MSKFDDFRFKDFDYKSLNNKYYEINRISYNKKKIIVNVADSHLLKTKYGYALILNKHHVVFLKDWQVDCNYYGNEVMLAEDSFNVRKWGNFKNIDMKDDENISWKFWLDGAMMQESLKNEEGYKLSPCRWRK